MHDATPKKSLKDKVLGLIRDRGVRMRPRWYFVLHAVLVVIGGVAAGLALIFVASFIIFTLRATGAWFVPAFGYAGMREFLTALPWVLVLLAAMFVIVLEILVKRYSFAYRQPLLYSAMAIIVIAAVGGSVIARTGFHRDLFIRAREHRLPVAEPLYRAYGMRHHPNVHPGTIIGPVDGGFRMKDPRDEEVTVLVTSETRFPYGTGIAEGDTVVVFGPRHEGTVQAFGIRKIDPALFDRRPPGDARWTKPRLFRCGAGGELPPRP